MIKVTLSFVLVVCHLHGGLPPPRRRPDRGPPGVTPVRKVVAVLAVAAAADLGGHEVDRHHEEEDAEDRPDDDPGDVPAAEAAPAPVGLDDDPDGVGDGGEVAGLVLGLDGEPDDVAFARADGLGADGDLEAEARVDRGQRLLRGEVVVTDLERLLPRLLRQGDVLLAGIADVVRGGCNVGI